MPIPLHHIYTQEDDVAGHRVRKHPAMPKVCEGIQDAANASEDCTCTNARRLSPWHDVSADGRTTIAGIVWILIVVKAGVSLLPAGGPGCSFTQSSHRTSDAASSIKAATSFGLEA